MKAKKVLVWLCAAAMLVSAAGCGSSAASTGSDAAGGQGVQEAEGTAKEDLPLAKYPEEVTVHLGGGMNPNAKIPEGMTYEDNTFLDMLKEDLNINVVYDWVASSSDYDEKMNLCIGSNTIPELMNVNAEQYRALLKYDLIQPIGSYYEDYASDKLVCRWTDRSGDPGKKRQFRALACRKGWYLLWPLVVRIYRWRCNSGTGS